MWLILLNERDVRSFRCLHQLLAQSLQRCRSRRTCVCAYIHVVRVCVYVCMYVCVCINIYICIYLHVYMYRYMHACIYMCICMCVHVCA